SLPLRFSALRRFGFLLLQPVSVQSLRWKRGTTINWSNARRARHTQQERNSEHSRHVSQHPEFLLLPLKNQKVHRAQSTERKTNKTARRWPSCCVIRSQSTTDPCQNPIGRSTGQRA